ncbi:MAG: hypothetical protein JXA97_12150 [Anaerolineales bacterium]|nr:hypothetical protein [Anaerolineales bacterium]
MDQPPRRKSLRLQGWDYRSPGAYFVTICTHRRASLFGGIVDDEMRLNACGEIAAKNWQAIPDHYAMARTDEFVIMPNHLHGIVLIEIDLEFVVGARHAVPLHGLPREERARFGQSEADSLSTIIRSYKSSVTRKINQHHGTPGVRVWQRGLYDHIIRNEDDLDDIRHYIQDNPLQWTLDHENPAAPLSHGGDHIVAEK